MGRLAAAGCRRPAATPAGLSRQNAFACVQRVACGSGPAARPAGCSCTGRSSTATSPHVVRSRSADVAGVQEAPRVWCNLLLLPVPPGPWQVLHDVGYQDGACVRPIIHRMSLVGVQPSSAQPCAARHPQDDCGLSCAVPAMLRHAMHGASACMLQQDKTTSRHPRRVQHHTCLAVLPPVLLAGGDGGAVRRPQRTLHPQVRL